jgi:signal transduction histidine kinase
MAEPESVIRKEETDLDTGTKPETDAERPDYIPRPSGIGKIGSAEVSQPDLLLLSVLHDIRNEVHSVIALFELFMDGIDGLTDSQRVDLIGIMEGLEALKNIAADELAIKAARKGRLTLDTSRMEIQSLLQDLIGAYRRKRHISLDIAGKPLWIEGDRNHLTRLFRNLIDNAIKFSRDFSPVHISFSEEEGFIKIEIADQGSGLPANPEKIFDPFEHGGHFTHGIGIGLAYCKMICEIHGGEIKAESDEKKKGTRITVLLPKVIPAT